MDRFESGLVIICGVGADVYIPIWIDLKEFGAYGNEWTKLVYIPIWIDLKDTRKMHRFHADNVYIPIWIDLKVSARGFKI